MKIKLILNKVLIRPDEGETRTKAGIILMEKSVEKPAHGTVINAGLGRFTDAGIRVPMDIKTGDKVYYHRNFAVPVEINGEKLVVVKEDDCQVAIEG